MRGKLCTTQESIELTDLNKVVASVEGKFGRVVLVCIKDVANMDRFEVLIERKPREGEHKNEINVGKEYISICSGLIDFENVAKSISNMKGD